MADRTVKVRLEADISDFVVDIGVKAPAAIDKLEASALRANKSIANIGDGNKLDDLGKKADVTGSKLERAGVRAVAAGRMMGDSAASAGKDVDQLAKSVEKADKATADSSKTARIAVKDIDSHANAVGRLRVAQLRLAEIQAKSTPSASSLAGAEESVKSAERAVKKFEEAGDKAGRGFMSRFGSGIKKWITGDGTSVFKQAGQNAGNGFFGALAGVLKTPVLGPIVAAALIAAVTAAAVPAGAVLAGGVVTAFGAGLAVLGSVFAAKSAVIKSIWAKTTADLGAQMRTISKPFESTLAAMAVVARRTFAGLKPELTAAFATLGPALTGFGDQLGQALGKLGPALQPLAGAFSKVLQSLGPALNDVFAHLASSLTKLSESISKNPTALADFARGLGGLVSDLLNFLTIMNNADAAFKRWTGGTSAVTVLMYALRGAVAGVLGPIQGLAQGLSAVGDGMNWAAGKLGVGKQVMDEASASTGTFAGNLLKATGSLTASTTSALHNAHATHQANVEAYLLATAFDRQAAATQKSIDALNRQSDLLLSLSGSETSYAQAILDANQAIKENGKTHDLSTQKGINNKRALDQVAASAIAQRDGMLKANEGTAKAAAAAETGRAAFIKLAQQMGYSKAEATAMAQALIKIPKKTEAEIKADITDLSSKLATAKQKLKDPTLTATQRAKLEAYIKNLEDGIAKAKRDLASVPSSKNVSITTTYTEIHRVVGAGSKSSSGGVGGGHEVTGKGQADGGYYPHGVPSYADGKLPSQAMIAPGKGGGMVQWAEQETGGEAFIPLAPSKRDRSEKILGQVAGEFGMGLVKSFANGGVNLPGGQLIDLVTILQRLGVPFDPTGGANYSSTLASANRANRAVVPARNTAIAAQRAEDSAKRQQAAIQRAITLQQRAVAAARAPKQTTKAGQAAEDRRVAAEQKKLIGLQDQLYVAKNKVTKATKASNAADAVLKIRQEAAAKAAQVNRDALEKLVQQQQAAVDLAKQISDSLTSGANIGDLFTKSLTGKGLLADLQDQGAALAKFRTQIDQLRKSGLSEDLIQQLVGKGAAGGGEAAGQIIAGGASLINALNKAQASLEQQANLIGAGSANVKYGVRVSGKRAGGGSTLPGKDYLVGEDGPEILRMGVTRGWIEPNRYVTNHSSFTRSTVIQQHNTFNGVSMAEADLIAQRANAKAELMNRGY